MVQSAVGYKNTKKVSIIRKYLQLLGGGKFYITHRLAIISRTRLEGDTTRIKNEDKKDDTNIREERERKRYVLITNCCHMQTGIGRARSPKRLRRRLRSFDLSSRPYVRPCMRAEHPSVVGANPTRVKYFVDTRPRPPRGIIDHVGIRRATSHVVLPCPSTPRNVASFFIFVFFSLSSSSFFSAPLSPPVSHPVTFSNFPTWVSSANYRGR